MPQPTSIFNADALQEADADLHDANDALHALMALLRACDPAQPLLAGALRGLLQPIAGSVEQASQALGVVTG